MILDAGHGILDIEKDSFLILSGIFFFILWVLLWAYSSAVRPISFLNSLPERSQGPSHCFKTVSDS
jgi:hypothetical protein